MHFCDYFNDMFYPVAWLNVSEYLPVYLTPVVGVIFRFRMIGVWQVIYKHLDRRYGSIQCWDPLSAACYCCPFALIRGSTRVSVRVCNMVVDPRVLGVLHVVSSPPLSFIPLQSQSYMVSKQRY